MGAFAWGQPRLPGLVPRGHGNHVLDLDQLLSLIGDGLIPDLGDEGLLWGRAHQVGVQVDPVPIFVEEDPHRGSENRLGGRLHVIAGLGCPGLGPALRPRCVALPDDVPFVDDDQASAIAGSDEVLVMVLDRHSDQVLVHTQGCGVSHAPSSFRFGWGKVPDIRLVFGIGIVAPRGSSAAQKPSGQTRETQASDSGAGCLEQSPPGDGVSRLDFHDPSPFTV